MNTKLVDCTLRDGGYYNNWDFNSNLITDYLSAMVALNVDYVEIGFRSLKNEGFKGGCAYSSDSYVNSLNIPLELKDRIGVMINGAELCSLPEKLLMADFNLTRFQETVLSQLFTSKSESPVTLVRIACHVHEFKDCLPAANWLKNQGYTVGFNLMQVADRTLEEMTELAKLASNYPVDVLYFADSMGSLTPEQTIKIVRAFQAGWNGELGIHTHDNMGQAVANTLQAMDAGVTWVDSTVTGMGRGPGNAQTEYLVLALKDSRKLKANPTKLLDLIRKHFKPLQNQYGWGTNPYYYLAGKYGIHPTYIQEMLSDTRYNEEDILAVISHLKIEGGKKFSFNTLDAARHFYSGEPRGRWNPADMIKGEEVLILGTGHGVAQHCNALEAYITKHKPFVIALNTQSSIKQELINIRAACHPVRLLADCHEHLSLHQPLVTPASMLPENVKQELSQKKLLDFGLSVQANYFSFQTTYCILPTSLVIAYVLAIATSGKAKKILLAGFDGYSGDDPRTKEMDHLLQVYQSTEQAVKLVSITPTRYEVETVSIYALIGN